MNVIIQGRNIYVKATPDKVNVETLEVLFDRINDRIEEVSNIPKSKFLSRSRDRDFVQWRHIGMWLLCNENRFALKKIGLVYGGMDHSSVLHGRDAIENAIKVKDYYIVSKLQSLGHLQGIKPNKPYLARQDERTRS